MILMDAGRVSAAVCVAHVFIFVLERTKNPHKERKKNPTQGPPLSGFHVFQFIKGFHFM